VGCSNNNNNNLPTLNPITFNRQFALVSYTDDDIDCLVPQRGIYHFSGNARSATKRQDAWANRNGKTVWILLGSTVKGGNYSKGSV